MDFEIKHANWDFLDKIKAFSYSVPTNVLTIKPIEVTTQPVNPSAADLLISFLKEKFPYQSIGYFDYTGNGAQPGDWKAPELTINNYTIGWLQQNYTTFVPYSYANARKKYQTIKLANPKFLDIFHKMAIYEFGYDPMKPGSREAYMDNTFEDFHPEVMKIYHSIKYKVTTSFQYNVLGFNGEGEVINIP